VGGSAVVGAWVRPTESMMVVVEVETAIGGCSSVRRFETSAQRPLV
jgi:hypothetical protein